MSKFAEPMSRLIDELKKLPGVGAKSAQRLAFHILRSSDEDAEALAAAVRDVKANLRLCSVCNNITDVDPCAYCTSPTRNQRLVCVVEEPTNIAAIEKTKHFNGAFHVLHGAISPLHGIGPEIQGTSMKSFLPPTPPWRARPLRSICRSNSNELE
jgi:recombination protein RecR